MSTYIVFTTEQYRDGSLGSVVSELVFDRRADAAKAYMAPWGECLVPGVVGIVKEIWRCEPDGMSYVLAQREERNQL